MPQRRGKICAGEIPRRHAPGVADHLRTGGDAGLDCLQHQLHIETGLLGDRKTLGDPRDLDRAHQIVDQFVDGARTGGAEMPDLRRKRCEKRPGLLEVGRLGADQQRQFSICRRIRQTRDGTVDIDQAASAQLACEFKRVTVRDGGALDHQRAGLRR